MNARCTICGLYWNVCLQKQFPPGGYVCPKCEGRQKRERREQSAKAADKPRDDPRQSNPGADRH